MSSKLRLIGVFFAAMAVLLSAACASDSNTVTGPTPPATLHRGDVVYTQPEKTDFPYDPIKSFLLSYRQVDAATGQYVTMVSLSNRQWTIGEDIAGLKGDYEFSVSDPQRKGTFTELTFAVGTIVGRTSSYDPMWGSLNTVIVRF